MISATEGSVQVDSNVGTVDELKAELATETPTAKARTGKLTTFETGDNASVVNTEDADDKPNADGASEAGRELGKKKRSLQARIDEISAERHTTARERDQARADVARLQAELDEARGGKPKTEAKADAQTVAGVPLDAEKFPKYADWLKTNPPEDKSDLEDWVDARDEWRGARETAKADGEKARTQHSEAFTKTISTFHDRLAPTLEADPKFYDKIDPRLLNTPAASALPPGTKVQFGNFLVEQVIKSEHPKDLLLWLSDPETTRRLVTLPPDDIIREFTKHELSIRPADDSTTGPSADEHDEDDEDDAEADKPTRRGSRPVEAATSQASPPIKPVRGSSQQSADQEPGDDASDDEWLRYERRKSQKSRAR